MDRNADQIVVEALAPYGSVIRRAVGVILFGTVIGVLGASAATGFVGAYDWLSEMLHATPSSRAALEGAGPLLGLGLLVPVAGGLLVGLCNRYLISGERAHGPPHVIRAAQSENGRLPLRQGVASAGAAIVSLGSGASVGQYGPLVHLGSTLGSVIGRWARPDARLGTIGIGCGTAAAISAAFHAPIAGVLFAHEVVLRHYSLRAFAPITVAATVAFFLVDGLFAGEPLFRIDAVPALNGGELGVFIAVGVVGALLAVVYMNAVLYAGHIAVRTRLPDFLRPACAGLGLGLLALLSPDILGMGFATVSTALEPGGYGAGELVSILVLKLVATALCLGFGFAGGVTGPAIVIGTLFGALIGTGMVASGAAAGMVTVYAIVGMASVVSPVMGAPITTVLIVFELTHNYDVTIAVLITVVFSNLVAYRLFGRSMFDVQLRRAGFDLRYGRDKVVLDDNSIGPWVSDEYVRFEPNVPCAQARQVIMRADVEEAQVVSPAGRYLGVVDLSRLDAAVDAGNGARPIADYVARPAVIIDTDMSIWEALARVKDFNGHAVPVLGGGRSERLAGVVPEPALIRAYLETLARLRDEENATP